MLKRVLQSACLALAAGIPATASQSAFAFHTPATMARGAPLEGLLQLADARSYYHCHNMPRRVRCHAKQHLPVNWPPNTNTPGTASLREKHADKSGTCSSDRSGGYCRR